MNASEAIRLQAVRYHWQPERPVLNIPELVVNAGENVFIKGPSGSGKTTLLSLVGGILSPQSGQILVSGQDLCQMSGPQRDRFRANHIGFIFQMFNLIPYLTVQENVLLPCSFSRLRTQRITAKGETLVLVLKLAITSLSSLLVLPKLTSCVITSQSL